jgi:virginiamycin B lyase
MRLFLYVLSTLALLAGCGTYGGANTPVIGSASGNRLAPQVLQTGPPPVHWMQLTHTFQAPLSPNDITAGPDGNIWVADPTNGVVRVDMAGHFTLYPLSSTNTPFQIVAGHHHDLWFTGGQGRQWVSRITTSGVVTQYPLTNRGSSGFGIARGLNGSMWFVDRGMNKIGRIAADGTIVEFSLPTQNADPLEIVLGPDHNMWFTEQIAGQVGRITPSGIISEFPLARAAGAIAAGPDGDLWVATSGSQYLYRVSPSGTIVGKVLVSQSPANIGDLVAGPDLAMWVGVYGGALPAALVRVDRDGFITQFPLVGGEFDRLTVGSDRNIWIADSGHALIDIFVRESLVPKPSTIGFTTAGQTQVVTVGEAGYRGTFSARSSNPAVATVVPGRSAHEFNVTSQGVGSCAITISDSRQNGYAVSVTVQ